jgi:hypothetical protein
LLSLKAETGVVLRVPRVHETGYYVIKFRTSEEKMLLHHSHFKVLNNKTKKPTETTISSNKEEDRLMIETVKVSISKIAVKQDAKVIDLTQEDKDDESTGSLCEIVEAPVNIDTAKTASGGKKANK